MNKVVHAQKSVLGASTFCLLHESWRAACETILDMGFTAVELFGDAPQAHFTQLDPGARTRLRSMSARCELSMHAPVFELNIASANPCSQDEAARQYREALYLAAEIGAKRLVVHEGQMSYWKLDRGAARETSAATLRQLVGIARQVGVTIGLENTNFGSARMYDSWEEWAAIAANVAELSDPALGLVLDTGHARLAGWDVPALVRALAPRLIQMHIHDTGGDRDEHLLPGRGAIDWTALGRAIVESGCQATLILESGPVKAADELRAGREWMERWLSR